MNCIVCHSPMEMYFSKDFKGVFDLTSVDYWKCAYCGFVGSKTHREMPAHEWELLNERVHASYQGTDFAKDDPKWLSRLAAQANIIAQLAEMGIIPRELPWVDFACGDGKLADQLTGYGFPTRKFDRYMHGGNDDYLTEEQLSATSYSNVINTSVAEHLLTIEPFDEIASLVSDSGVLSLHTLVRETIPPDPDWFYLVPVHVSFYTNRSMEILFEKYRFKASVYHLGSTMWFWFRDSINSIETLVENFNRRGTDQLIFKHGFIDYWK